jgi:HAD superfamily hydrolase (TIGR01509 family)
VIGRQLLQDEQLEQSGRHGTCERRPHEPVQEADGGIRRHVSRPSPQQRDHQRTGDHHQAAQHQEELLRPRTVHHHVRLAAPAARPAGASDTFLRMLEQDSPDAEAPATEEAPAAPASPKPPENPAALIFDLDGTLVDTVNERIEAWMRTFAEIGIKADRQHVAGLIGADGKRLALEVAAVAGRPLSEDRAEAVDRRAGEIFSQLAGQPKPLPGARDLLTALDDAGVPWSIATSSRPEQAKPSLDALGLSHEPRFTDGSHVKHAKPAPDLLLLAAEQLEVPTHRCWYVGDATWDMRAARSAGMTLVGIATGAVSIEALRSAGAQLAFHSLTELHDELARRGVVAPRS